MKKIIIAIFIIVSVIGIAAGTTAKKAPSKSSTVPKKEVEDPYVGWWYYTGDEIFFGEFDLMLNITKENEQYYARSYMYFPKTKGAIFCKGNIGQEKYKISKNEIIENGGTKATKEQIETLLYNLKYMKGATKEICDI